MIKSSFTCNSLNIKHILNFLYKALFSMKTEKMSKSFINEISKYFGISKDSIFLFGSARMGLYTLLKSLNLKEKDEVILPGYTCVVVSNAIKYLNVKAKYVDIDEKTLNIDTTKLIEAITEETKVIVICHNFGIVYEDIKLIKENYPNIIIIEDAAHTFGSIYSNKKKVGLLGDASFFSFEYSKPITTGMGGLLIINNAKLIPNVDSLYKDITFYPKLYNFKIFMTLFFHLLTSYEFTCFLKGLFMRLLKVTKLLFQSSESEIQGEFPKFYPVKLSKLLSYIGYLQLKDINQINNTKKNITKKYYNAFESNQMIKNYYNQNYNYVRYPIVFDKTISIEVINRIKKRIQKETGLSIGEWFNDVIHPKGSFRHCYIDGTCRVGEGISKRIINLPVNVHLNLDDKIIEKIKNIFSYELL